MHKKSQSLYLKKLPYTASIDLILLKIKFSAIAQGVIGAPSLTDEQIQILDAYPHFRPLSSRHSFLCFFLNV